MKQKIISNLWFDSEVEQAADLSAYSRETARIRWTHSLGLRPALQEALAG